MNTNFNNWLNDFKHDLRNLQIQVEGALTLIEQTKDEKELQEIHKELLQGTEKFLERQSVKK